MGVKKWNFGVWNFTRNMTKIYYILISVLLCISILRNSSAEVKRARNQGVTVRRKLQGDPLPKKPSGKAM